jgi:hypothetical protein
VPVPDSVSVVVVNRSVGHADEVEDAVVKVSLAELTPVGMAVSEDSITELAVEVTTTTELPESEW